MKSFKFLFILFLLQITSLQAQDNTAKTSGTVYYTEKRSLEIKTEGIPQEILNQLPREIKKFTELKFNKLASVYQNCDKKEENTKKKDIEQASSGVIMNVRTIQSENILYTDFVKKIVIEKKEFMGKDFLINDSVKLFSWKIKPEQKMILGYSCQKAIYEADSTKIEAWFTPVIAVPGGPASYGNLPGLILEVNNLKTKELITATEIKTEDVDPSGFVAPTGGKKVNSTEFKKIVDEKTKELQQQYGGSGGNVIIKMSR